VTVLSRQGAASLAWDDAARLQQVADVRYQALEEAPGRAEATMLLRGTEILAATNACLPVLDAPLLDALPELRAVVLYATGYGHIDLDLLASRGVGLCVLPDYATGAVAEHAIAMLLAMATRLHLAHDRSRRLVHRATSLRGIELAGRTLGVVGVGRIGMRVARLADGLGMRIVGTDIDEAAVALARGDGIAMADLSELLAASDALVVCASHAYDAPAVLGHAELRSMRHGSLLVNVSRAALVDTAAAVAAVRAGWLRGYAVDDVVLDPAVDGDLLAQGRVLQTGHSAWWRDEVLERGRRMWARHLLAAVAGTPLDAVTWPAATSRAVRATGAPLGRQDLAVSR
jgi:lactate dehydrogenase-like 2-hydroxyacid dehydrogenase